MLRVIHGSPKYVMNGSVTAITPSTLSGSA